MSVAELKNVLIYNWNVVRIVRVAIGCIALYQAIAFKDGLIGVFAFLLLAQGIMNWSCCGTGSCTTVESKPTTNELNKEVEYEEVKPL